MITLEHRRERGDLIVMYRIMTGNDDVPHTTWFQKMTEIDSCGVRTRTAAGTLNVLPPGQPKTDVRKHFFSQRVVENWNGLPDTVKMSETVNQFKNTLDEFKAWGGHPWRRSQEQQQNLVTT